MRKRLAVGALCGILVFAAQAREGGGADTPAARAAPAEGVPTLPPPDLSGWTKPLQAAIHPTFAGAPAPPLAAPGRIDDDIDVVDAHWMALTMWGEARGQGEDGMRAVGHVIRNRWQAKSHGAYVTDTVSAAWQFSCWNRNDPNRAAMLAIDDLPKEGAAHRQWLAAKRIAAEILSGRSVDPTGGALFYHTTAVHPKWSQGVAPIAKLGDHLFFLTAR